MIGKKMPCWRCRVRMTVAPYVEDSFDQVCIISGIEFMPETIRSFIQSKVPMFSNTRKPQKGNILQTHVLSAKFFMAIFI